MTQLFLKLRLPNRIDVSSLSPDRLASLSVGDIEKLPLRLATQSIRVGDAFTVTKGEAGRVVFQTAEPVLEHVGAGMESGDIIVEGPAGVHAGSGMKGGTLRIKGDAGDFAGVGKSGGLLIIDGSAGDFVGAALPGQTAGASGGAIVVRGNVGQRFGDRLRRGVVIALGNAGANCASRAIAGTIWVRGQVGDTPAQGLKRATLLLEKAPPPLPTFLDCGVHELGMLRLLLPSLDRLAGTEVAKRNSVRARRHLGCVGLDGRGEVLVLA